MVIPARMIPIGMKEFQVQTSGGVTSEVRRIDYTYLGVDFPELNPEYEAVLHHINGSVTILRSGLAPFCKG